MVSMDSRTFSELGFKRKPSAFNDGEVFASEISSPERIIRNFDSSYLSLNFNNSNLKRSSDWKLRTFHITKSGVLSPVPLLKLISKFW